MKTQGVRLVAGSIVLPFPQAVPPAFWSRLKHAVDRAALRAEFVAEYELENFQVRKAREAITGWNAGLDSDREAAMFQRWVERVVGPQALWPWQRGWTEQLVDEYLQAPVRAGAAA